MKAVVFRDFGGSDKLEMSDTPTPIPSANEVLIEIKYAAVNPVDWKIREGYLKEMLPYRLPIIPGWDASGVVKAIGDKVNKFKVGDEIFAYCRKPMIQSGTYAEYVTLDQAYVAKKPKNISFAEASAIPLVGLTAWQSLFESAKLKKGQTILIHAGAGGVGSLAIQLAKHTGAKVITTASLSNHPYVKKLGADIAIDYSKGFIEEVKKVAPLGVDIVFDCAGAETLKNSYNLVKPKGHIVSIVKKPDPDLCEKNDIVGSYVFVEPNGEQLTKIAELIEKKAIISPTIEEMPLTQAAHAQDKNRQGHTQGKIVLKVSSTS